MKVGLTSERIGDILQLQRRVVEVDPLAMYKLIGVYSFGKGIFHREPTRGTDLGAYRFFLIKNGDLVLSNIQAWEGAIAQAGSQDNGCIGTHRFMTYVPINKQADTNYLRYFFLSEQGMDLIRKASPGSIVRNRTLGIEAFESLEIPLPPIDEQHLLAMKLDRIGAYTADLVKLSARAANTTTALGTSMSARPDLSDTVKAELGWREVDLCSVMQPARDRVNVELNCSYPNLGIYSFGRGLFVKPNIEGGATSAKVLSRVHSGQFIYSRLFAFEGAYGFVSREFDEYFVSNEFPAFDTDPEQLDAQWLASYLRSPDRWAELASSSKGLGVRRQRVPVESVLAYKVWLPPIEQQRAMARMNDVLDFISTERIRSDQRIKSLMSAAINEAFADLT